MAAEVSKAALLIKAEQMLKVGGLASFNMRTLAKECGIAVGSVYNCYPSKNHLIFALMQKLFDECASAFDKAVEEDLLSSILSCYKITLDFVGSFKYNLMFELSGYITEFQGKDVDMAQHLSVFYRHINKLLERFNSELGPSAREFSREQLCEMTMRVFYSYIADNSTDFCQMKFLWGKILID